MPGCVAEWCSNHNVVYRDPIVQFFHLPSKRDEATLQKRIEWLERLGKPKKYIEKERKALNYLRDPTSHPPPTPPSCKTKKKERSPTKRKSNAGRKPSLLQWRPRKLSVCSDHFHPDHIGKDGNLTADAVPLGRNKDPVLANASVDRLCKVVPHMATELNRHTKDKVSGLKRAHEEEQETGTEREARVTKRSNTRIAKELPSGDTEGVLLKEKEKKKEMEKVIEALQGRIAVLEKKEEERKKLEERCKKQQKEVKELNTLLAKREIEAKRVSLEALASLKEGEERDGAVKTLTGLPEHGDLLAVVEIVKQLRKKKKPVEMKDGRIISVADGVLYTLIRLRHGLTHELLGYFAGVPSRRLSDIYNVNCEVLAAAQVLFFEEAPTREQLKDKKARCFSGPWEDVRFIIDCTEVQVEIPSDLEGKRVFYSNYKSRYTIKYLVVITPDMKMRYISEGHGGSITDPALTALCVHGFLSQIKPGDKILADKGFRIFDLIARKGGEVLLPAFVDDGVLNAEEATYSQRLANVRVHVERAISRMKEFAAMSNTVEQNTVGMQGYVAKAVTFLCNMMPPLIKDMV